jgi:hypothetical protein
MVLSRLSPEPMAAVRDGNVIAWDVVRLVPTADAPERTWVERSYLLLDVGIQLKMPHWWHESDPGTWYIDLVQIEDEGDLIRERDLYLDVIVPTDGRPYRMIDIDEFGDALASGALSLTAAMDGLRRWQLFLDTYLHVRGQLTCEPFWRDFPPACLREVDRKFARQG